MLFWENRRYSVKVNVRCVEISGPFFFVNKQWHCYLDSLQLYLLPQLEDHQSHVMFQQDGTPPQWANIVWEFLDIHFHGCWVGHDEPVSWILHLSDVTSLGFFLGGALRTLFTDPCDLLHCTEAQNYCCDKKVHHKCCRTLRGKHHMGFLCTMKIACV